METGRLYDITPDKSLVKKIGMVGYRTEQAIAELVDNAIDARAGDGRVNIRVRLDFKWRRILVEDDGAGMNGSELADAMTIAKETQERGMGLGRFGMGMKSACSALGSRFAITTSKAGSDTEYSTEYDEEEWMSDGAHGWKSLRINERPAGTEGGWHGTRISISGLSVPLYPNQVSNLKESFGIRYSPYIEGGQISLHINTVQCRPAEQDVEPGSRTELHIPLNDGVEITGHVALLKRRSVRGNYGFHLFWRNRLIKAFAKIGFPAHPENARIIGRINLDHVPVNYTKSGFLEESGEYAEAAEKFAASEDLKAALRASASGTGASAPSVASVFGRIVGTGEWYALGARARAKQSMDAIAATEPFTVEYDGRRMDVKVERGRPDAPLYTADAGKDVTRVSINAGSNVFRFVKNPLFLVGMIASEAKLLGSCRNAHELLERRNRDMSGLLGERGRDGRTHEAADGTAQWRLAFRKRHDYALGPELVGAHDILVEKHDVRFQFTALSTLSPYMHDLGGKLVYTIHTLPPHGEMVVSLLAEEMGREFAVVDRPSAGTVESLLRIPYVERVLAVREYRTITGSTVAAPASAFVDLMAEVFTRGIAVLDREGLRKILGNMMRLGVVDLEDLRRHAKAVKRARQLDGLLKGIPA